MVRGSEFPQVQSGIVSITYIDVRPEALTSFMQNVREVFSAATRAPGILRYYYHNKDNRFYTLTVWESRERMDQFRDSEPHASAMRRVRIYAKETKFVNPDTMPRNWEEAKVMIQQAEERPPRTP